MPLATRGASSRSPDSETSATGVPLRMVRGRRRRADAAVDAFSSTSVFHSPQASHLPDQRGVDAPQFWQTKDERDFDMRIPEVNVLEMF